MNTIWFYILAILPVVAGGFVWLFDRKRVNWKEWIISSCAAFALAGIFHALSVAGQTRDEETWSGQFVTGRHYAAWKEYYEYAVYRTEVYTTSDSKGNISIHTREVFDHWEPTTRWHRDQYEVWSNIDTSYYISHDWFYQIAQTFGGYRAVQGDRETMEHNSRMIGGDPNDYVTEDGTGYVWPVTKHMEFKNKIKATPTTFSFAPVPATVKVFPYPRNEDPFKSDRLEGTSKEGINLFSFDQMNARLGPKKKVNVILVGFGNRDEMMAEWQQSAYIGGKKNDVVITWGGPNGHPNWVRAFGWTDSKTCLRNLETIVLEHGATDATLPLIEQEITSHYVLKNWDQAFAYIRVPAAPWAFWTYMGVLIVLEAIFWIVANKIGADNEGNDSRYSYRSRPRNGYR